MESYSLFKKNVFPVTKIKTNLCSAFFFILFNPIHFFRSINSPTLPISLLKKTKQERTSQKAAEEQTKKKKKDGTKEETDEETITQYEEAFR